MVKEKNKKVTLDFKTLFDFLDLNKKVIESILYEENSKSPISHKPNKI